MRSDNGMTEGLQGQPATGAADWRRAGAALSHPRQLGFTPLRLEPS